MSTEDYMEDSDERLYHDDDYEASEDLEEEAGPSGQQAPDYKVLSVQDITRKQAAAVQEVVSILGVCESDAATLLRHYRWSAMSTSDEWFNGEERVCKAVGLLRNGTSKAGPSMPKKGSQDKLMCEICYDEQQPSDTEAPPCGHHFCRSCWQGYINAAINEGPGSLLLRCPQPKCGAAVGRDMVQVLASPAERKKYETFMLRSFVEDNPNIKWCPAPGCGYALQVDSVAQVGLEGAPTRSQDVHCKCNHVFCWTCLEEPHKPVDCEVIKNWLIKNSAESGNQSWILANAKACPKCKRPIEKNHGCMHMTCSAPCRFEFCWLCLCNWKQHGENTGGFYSCNRYESAKAKGDYDEEENRRRQARHELQRYLHFYERWAQNEASRLKALESLHRVEKKDSEELRRMYNQPASLLKFLAEAWEQIVECRRVLKWTYAYGFYLPEGEVARKTFFEYLQGEAEAGLERLHKCAEKDVEDFLPTDSTLAPEEPTETSLSTFNVFRSKLSHLTSVTGTYFDNLVRALETGLAEVEGGTSGSKDEAGAEEQRKRKRLVGGEEKGNSLPAGPAHEEEAEDGDFYEEDGDPEEHDVDEDDFDEDDDEDDMEDEEEEERVVGMAHRLPPEYVNLRDEDRAAAEADPQAPWTCPHCTFANQVAAAESCSMCALPRHPEVPLEQ